MKTDHIKSAFIIICSTLLMVSCIDGGSSGTLTAGGGIGGTGVVSQGAISEFDSIWVNGTEFDTRTAVLVVDGEEIGIGDMAVLSYLDIGKVVTVIGTQGEDDSSATADRVTYNKNIEGPVESVRETASGVKEIQVLGQTVYINAVTTFKETSFDAVAENDMLEVSGFMDDTGAIWATFVEKTGDFSTGVIVEMTGYVTVLDEAFKTFEINGQAVDYSVADTSSLPEGAPVEGQWVEAAGTLDDTGSEMLASRIEPGDELDVDDADGIEVTGFVTEKVSASEFVVGNQTVRAEEDAVFVDGGPEDVQSGAKLEAEGRLVGGILFAHEIEFWEPDQIELEGYVTDVISDNEFTIGDQVVQTSDDTVYEDGESEDIEIGVKIEIKGCLVGGTMLADKVSFE